MKKYIFLFFCGGFVYCMLEILTRGFSHISMLVAGGLSFVIVGSICELLDKKISIWLMMFFGMVVITVIEYISGLIVNKYLHLNVWDYSMYSFNIDGQVCLWFSLIWYALSYVIIKVYHILYKWFDRYSAV